MDLLEMSWKVFAIKKVHGKMHEKVYQHMNHPMSLKVIKQYLIVTRRGYNGQKDKKYN